MPKLQERKTQTGTTFVITVPKEYVEKMGWKKGDTIFFSILNNKSLKIEK
ncbi:MAG: AbrB/MazE/SpoVT family DNA-binding domain-containing protein [Candidatus Hodarchaeales archaeon]|jgi:antitoxin component of MazEF toxin-antitoxin module